MQCTRITTHIQPVLQFCIYNYVNQEVSLKIILVMKFMCVIDEPFAVSERL